MSKRNHNGFKKLKLKILFFFVKPWISERLDSALRGRPKTTLTREGR